MSCNLPLRDVTAVQARLAWMRQANIWPNGLRYLWTDAFGVVRAPAFGAILVLGLVLLAIFLLWLAAAYGIYYLTLGPEPPLRPSRR